MPLQATSGAASYDATGGGAPVINYIEDVFSTWLYTGNGSTQTITNGINLAGKGGLVWMKGRFATTDHGWYDTARGATFDIGSNLTTGQTTQSTGLTSFGSTGFSLGALAKLNTNAATYASWTFREQPKFFDVVTYTGTGANRTIAHNLGSVPGCIIVKRTNTTGDWQVYHRSLANTQYMVLNARDAVATGATRWNSTTPTSTVFSLGVDSTVNASGGTYVAYIFAHNAGGFGLTGASNVISCGSYTGNGASDGPVISLGYEPQWVLIKSASSAFNDWQMYDSMRGLIDVPTGTGSSSLIPNSAAIESATTSIQPTATGFKVVSPDGQVNSDTSTYIYMAIRRGPMKVPTTGTSVFSPKSATSGVQTVNFPIDLQLLRERASLVELKVVDRIREVSTTTTEITDRLVWTTSDTAETSSSGWTNNWGNTAFTVPSSLAGVTSVFWSFRRAPSFFDSVFYKGTGSNTSRTHNLGVAPELWIVKRRDAAGAWQVGSTAIANTEYLVLNTTAAKATGATRWNSTYPTASVFTTGTEPTVNQAGQTFLAYFFASCPGVSKVGSYTGNGSSQTINCGFTAGSRFVLIKRTDSTGDWYVWDSARGIVSGNDPHISLNTTAAEVTTNDTIDTDSTGFVVNQVAATSVNVTSATYIFLAIA